MEGETFVPVPIGLWGRHGTQHYKQGGQMLTNLIDGLDSFGTVFLQQGGNEAREAQQLIDSVMKQYKDSTWEMFMEL